ncbi:signal recognition particle-docking protein FtsY [Candidatus Bathyarchaeota archaeon]|nr:signal recognition particle-docking protein FtsY [Candidatus Bathyarchaeota archaeon]
MFERLRESLKGLVERLSKRRFTEEELDQILWELQLQLISNDVALKVAEHIGSELKRRLLEVEAPRFGDRGQIVREALREALREILTAPPKDLPKMVEEKRRSGEPLILLFIGVNGTGKTTTIAKVAKLLTDHGYRVVLASGDTYRAGAIEQLEEHARRLGLRVIRHRYGADPAAVSYDAVEHARARGYDAVLIDTAGRMQTNRNLMEELRKIKRVIQPDLTILVVDALTGNDAVEQAETFNREVGFDAAIITKVDADARGGSSLSIAYSTGKPILYLGTGQGYGDLQPFNPDWLVERLLP